MEARLLYYALNFEGNIAGEIVGAKRICKGYGFGDAAFSELVEGGLLLELEGCCIVRHHFVHNGLANQAQKVAATKAMERLEGVVAFEGEAFNSPYCLVSPNVSLTVDTKEEVEAKQSERTRTKANQTETKENANAPQTRPCPVCERDYLVADAGLQIYGECLEHGYFYIDKRTGEYVEGVA